jgi:hypothetical protein
MEFKYQAPEKTNAKFIFDFSAEDINEREGDLNLVDLLDYVFKSHLQNYAPNGYSFYPTNVSIQNEGYHTNDPDSPKVTIIVEGHNLKN